MSIMENDSELTQCNYWLIAPGENAGNWNEQRESGVIGIAWDDLGDIAQYGDDFESFLNDFKEAYKDGDKDKTNSAKQVWAFYKDINVGDVVFARKGVLQIIGMGIVKSDYYYDGTKNEYTLLRKVDWKKVGNWNYPGQSSRETVHKLRNEQVMEILKAMNEQENEKILSLCKLLKNTRNLILHGAPGTGKTHLAKDIAAQIICNKNYKELSEEEKESIKDQIGFVQFHPSYDYTDFVEGLRPVHDENDNVVFERKDGVFKDFCSFALENLINSKKNIQILDQELTKRDILDTYLAKMIADEYEFSTLNGNIFNIINFNHKHISIKYITKKNIIGNVNIKYSDLFTLIMNNSKKINRSQIKDIMNRSVERQEDSYTCSIYNEYICEDHPENSFTKLNSKLKMYVFIIDEINRGELSKIFGELFYNIDPGYRGESGKISTQYQNLVEEDDPFYDGFFIPENVYIIGTMNDIDRSVESMDFAFRRRFTFKEITAKETQENILKDLDDSIREEAVKRMNSLNTAIDNIEGLSSAYHIGGAYFLKLKELGNNFDLLWNYHLEGLLREYLRGMEDSETLLEDLHKAYNLESKDNQ